MKEIAKLVEDLNDRMLRETESLAAERASMRDVAETRERALTRKRDEEIRRIETWAAEQKEIVQVMFKAMIAEARADALKHDAAVKLLSGETPSPPPVPGSSRPAMRPASALKRAAQPAARPGE